MPYRPDFWGIEPLWTHFVIYAIMTLAGAYMVYRVYQLASMWWKVGRPEKRTGQFWQRLLRLIKEGAIQLRILNKGYAGIMHALIAWSFFLLFLGTPVGVLNAYIFPGFLKGNIFLVFKLLMDLAVITYLIGVGMAAYRRFIQKPDKITQDPRFNQTLMLLTLIVLPTIYEWFEARKPSAQTEAAS